MDVLVSIEHGHDLVEEVDVEGLCALAMGELGLPEETELSVTFVDNDAIAKLNETYRGKEGPTDVLSFECDNLDDEMSEQRADGEPYELGDIVIAPDVAAANSDDLGVSVVEEIELLLVHGVLHLCGWDHEAEEEAEAMEAREKEILALWRKH